AIWAWGYLGLASAQAPVTSELLDWTYERMIPLERQNWVESTFVNVPVAHLKNGETIDDLRDVVDVEIKSGSTLNGLRVLGIPRLHAEQDTRGAGAIELDLTGTSGQEHLLEDAVRNGTPLTVTSRRSGAFATTGAPGVDLPSFERIGHALLGILAGLTG